VTALGEPLARLLDRAPPSWASVVQAWRASAEGRRLEAFMAQRQAAGATIYPADVLRALAAAPREQVRVVILGQDPYHGAGQAEGLAFSVPRGQRVPPSLRNIHQELARDLQQRLPEHGHLGAWANQGVLLLNTCLTVEDGRPAAHGKKGWEALTDGIIMTLSSDKSPKVFMLWGVHAQARAALVDTERHVVLQANHPSPLSARRAPQPFVGCGHFSAANRYLVSRGLKPVDWSLA
jgi:uracil-DNA glycosylase